MYELPTLKFSMYQNMSPPSRHTRCLGCGFLRGGNFEFSLQAPKEMTSILLSVIWKCFQTDFHIVINNANQFPDPSKA